jgi:hypothetical protein
MPWKRAKALPPPDNALFEACFRIQREACEAAGRHIPLIVENVRGAQPWVGRARWNYGSFYLWGDVPALMPMIAKIPLQGDCFTEPDHPRPHLSVIGNRGRRNMTPKEQYEARKTARREKQLDANAKEAETIDLFDRFVTAIERIAAALEPSTGTHSNLTPDRNSASGFRVR